MEYISRILMLILMGMIYVLPGYFLHRVIVGNFPDYYRWSLSVLTIGLVTFPIGNILVRWKLNNFTSFVELIGGIFLYFYTFAIVYLLFHIIASYVPNYEMYKVQIFIGYFVIVGILSIIGYHRAHDIRVNTYTLQNQNVTKNIKILMFSDIHLSQVSKKDIIKKIADVVEERKPDMVLIPGDIIDTDTKLIKFDYSQDFKRIKAPLGVYASVGNHEYYGDFGKNVKYISSQGIRVLYEEGVEIGDYYIVGRSYSFGSRKTLEELTKGNINKKQVIVLDHSPKESKDFMKFGGFLQVSGHTHHGQFFPYNLITKMMFKPSWGIWKEKGSNVITSCGLGYWAIPIKLPSYAEIVEIDVNK